jgi:hypothetical protein
MMTVYDMTNKYAKRWYRERVLINVNNCKHLTYKNGKQSSIKLSKVEIPSIVYLFYICQKNY